ncbi:hypothetical protein EDC01DRAFT_479929 [Geopyxis carbonaria]|nr:hypothetical protein EDC01DRAFT_479929 [Geopyxis carbonaria]
MALHERGAGLLGWVSFCWRTAAGGVAFDFFGGGSGGGFGGGGLFYDYDYDDDHGAHFHFSVPYFHHLHFFGGGDWAGLGGGARGRGAETPVGLDMRSSWCAVDGGRMDWLALHILCFFDSVGAWHACMRGWFDEGL